MKTQTQPLLLTDPRVFSYYEPTPEPVRSWVLDLVCTVACKIENVIRLHDDDFLFRPLSWLSEGLWSLWTKMREGTADDAWSAIHGEIPLCYLDEWQRAHFADFDRLWCRCVEPDCHWSGLTMEADDDLSCPLCGDEHLFLL